MPTIHIHDVPQDIYEEFRQLALADGFSLHAEARVIFEEGIRLRKVRISRAEALQMADESRKQVGRTGVDSLELLREGREEG